MIREIKVFIVVILQCIIHYYGGVAARVMKEKPGEAYDMMIKLIFTRCLTDLIRSIFLMCD